MQIKMLLFETVSVDVTGLRTRDNYSETLIIEFAKRNSSISAYRNNGITIFGKVVSPYFLLTNILLMLSCLHCIYFSQ